MTPKKLIDKVKKFDWKGLAKAYHGKEVSWNATNWKKFVEEIQKDETKRVAKEINKVRPKEKVKVSEFEDDASLGIIAGYNTALKKYNKAIKKVLK